MDMFTLGRVITLQDCLDFMVAEGVFTREQLHAALVYLQDGSPKPSRDVMRVVEVVMGMKSSE